MIRQPSAPHAPTLTPRRSPATIMAPAASVTVSPAPARVASATAASPSLAPASSPARVAAPVPAPARYRGAGLVLILVAAFMVVLDFSIVNVALPSIQRELGFAASAVQWVVTGYAITFGGL